MSAAIETTALTRRFKRHLAVDAVSMTVPDQAVYGFLGRNGAGKTTTLKMLLGLIRPSGGTAHGRDGQRRPIDHLRSQHLRRSDRYRRQSPLPCHRNARGRIRAFCRWLARWLS